MKTKYIVRNNIELEFMRRFFSGNDGFRQGSYEQCLLSHGITNIFVEYNDFSWCKDDCKVRNLMRKEKLKRVLK